MTAFEARSSRGKLALLVLLSAGMTAGALWIVQVGNPDDPRVLIGGYGGVLFFGLCTILLARRMIAGGVELRIDASGIHAKRFGAAPIPFRAIRHAMVVEHHRQKMLTLFLYEPERYQAATRAQRMLAAANAGMGFGEVSLSTTGTDRRFDELLAAFDHFSRAAGGPVPL